MSMRDIIGSYMGWLRRRLGDRIENSFLDSLFQDTTLDFSLNYIYRQALVVKAQSANSCFVAPSLWTSYGLKRLISTDNQCSCKKQYLTPWHF